MPLTNADEPVPADLHGRISAMTHDLRRARELLAAGRIDPRGQAALDRFFAQRLEGIEADVHRRLLEAAMRGHRPAVAQPT